MKQEERLDYLIGKLLAETEEIENNGNTAGERKKTVNTFTEEQKPLVLRSLMNVRMPYPIDETFLKIQGDYLAEERERKGVVTLSEVPTVREQYGSSHPFADKISLWQGDITRLSVDAIVNAANSQMLGCFVPCHRCIDNAIHSAAGMELREECYHLMQKKKIRFGPGYEEPTGQAEITKGYHLPAKYVIHTVGPIVSRKVTDALRQDLVNCYRNALKCAINKNVRSIAFCCISTGEFRFPNEEAARIAVDTVTKMLEEQGEHFERIVFNVFKDLDKTLYEKLLAK